MRRGLTWVLAALAVVVGVVALATASVQAQPGAHPRDVPTTDGVTITVEVPGPPTPTALPTPTARPTPSHPGGPLPKTGEPIALVAGLGLSLLVAGVVVLVLARRRGSGGTG